MLLTIESLYRPPPPPPPRGWRGGSQLLSLPLVVLLLSLVYLVSVSMASSNPLLPSTTFPLFRVFVVAAERVSTYGE